MSWWGALVTTVKIVVYLSCLISVTDFNPFFVLVKNRFLCRLRFVLICPFPRVLFFVFVVSPQVQFRQIGPGMVQQLQSACPVCRGEGKMINERDKCKTCSAKKVRKRNNHNK